MSKREKLNSLAIKKIHEMILESLSNKIESNSNISHKPLVIQLKNPTPYKFRIYAFNCNNPPGGRPLGEFKIVLNVGQEYRERGNFDDSEGCIPIVLGYVNSHEVYVIWDAKKHVNFAYNKNLQVKSVTILEALANKISYQKRNTQKGIETVIAARKNYLYEALIKRMDILIHEILEK